MGSSTGEEQVTQYPKFKGLNPAASAIGREKIMGKDVYGLTDNGFSPVVEQITYYLKMKGFNATLACSGKIVGK